MPNAGVVFTLKNNLKSYIKVYCLFMCQKFKNSLHRTEVCQIMTRYTNRYRDCSCYFFYFRVHLVLCLWLREVGQYKACTNRKSFITTFIYKSIKGIQKVI